MADDPSVTVTITKAWSHLMSTLSVTNAQRARDAKRVTRAIHELGRRH